MATQARRAPAKAPVKAPAKKAVAPRPMDEVVKKVYVATGRGGVERRSTSATPLTHAVDCKISGRKQPAFGVGVVVAFYSSKEKAQAAADKINSSTGEWSDAVIVGVKVAK